MKKLRLFALFLILVILTGLLLGCSKKAVPESNDNIGGGNEVVGDGIYESGDKNTESATIPSRKLIRTISIEAQTKDLDALLSDLDTQLAVLGGYVQSKQVHGGTDNSARYAKLTLRIPADKLDQFVNHVSGASNITSSKETTEDVTLNFIATESRITALETEEARILELVTKANTLNEILTLESKLADIRQELEEARSQLKLYENLVDYGTIHLNIQETREYTVVEEKEPTVWERISDGFVDSLKGVGGIFVELFVQIIVALPYLVTLAAIVAVILFIRKKKKK